jgi:TRAP-type transport system large permease protein
MLAVAALGLVLLFVGVPVAFALGLAGMLGVWLAGIPMSVVATRLFTGVDSFVFLAVPFYILAAEIMGQGGITPASSPSARRSPAGFGAAPPSPTSAPR